MNVTLLVRKKPWHSVSSRQAAIHCARRLAARGSSHASSASGAVSARSTRAPRRDRHEAARQRSAFLGRRRGRLRGRSERDQCATGGHPAGRASRRAARGCEAQHDPPSIAGDRPGRGRPASHAGPARRRSQGARCGPTARRRRSRRRASGRHWRAARSPDRRSTERSHTQRLDRRGAELASPSRPARPCARSPASRCASVTCRASSRRTSTCVSTLDAHRRSIHADDRGPAIRRRHR